METDSKYKKLVKNSAVFFIGNLGSKVITFLIVPFYTYFLTTEEYRVQRGGHQSYCV